MTKKPMTEQDVSRTARREIRREYHTNGKVIWHFEAPQWDARRPDLIVIIEYQSRNRQWVVHSVESKVDRRYLTSSDQRYVCDGVKQARSYRANYRWLAISKEVLNDLWDYEWLKLKRDCRGTKHNVGLMVAYRTKVDIYVNPGYVPGYFIPHYRDEEWYEETLGGG